MGIMPEKLLKPIPASTVWGRLARMPAWQCESTSGPTVQISLQSEKPRRSPLRRSSHYDQLGQRPARESPGCIQLQWHIWAGPNPGTCFHISRSQDVDRRDHKHIQSGRHSLSLHLHRGPFRESIVRGIVTEPSPPTRPESSSVQLPSHCP